MSTETSSNALWRLNESFPSVSGAGESCFDAVCEQLESRAWSAGDVFAMRLALSEAFENAVEHGNKRDPSKSVHLSVELDDARAIASVRDEGPGFPVENAPDPTLEANLEKVSGRGLFLIRNFMTNVWHNKEGNVIYMEKEKKSEE